jgi:hypothetical protein
MTYKELLNNLNNMNESQLNSDLTILEGNNEFYQAKLLFAKQETNDILDNNHPFICRV